jgi:hypothetical protein
MPDLRYHAVSLAAVFLALLLGLAVGAALADPELGNKAENARLKNDVTRLEDQVDGMQVRLEDLRREQDGARTFVESAYPLLMQDRLDGIRVALVFVGPVDVGVRNDVEQALGDAGTGDPLRIRALSVPLEVEDVRDALAGRPAVAGYAQPDNLDDLGRALGQELVEGGETPLWDALDSVVVLQQRGDERAPVDGVVVVRNSAPQGGDTGRFLAGLFAGLRSSVPAVGVESVGAEPSAVPAFRRHQLSSVDNVETPVGRLALSVLLAGGRPGHYGVKPTAENGLLPPLEPVRTTTGN